jgi:MinD superfamily P-loop ATPase
VIITVASGKGGTGKTLIAASLALSIDEKMTFLDCDVEEPNSAIFLKPRIEKEEEATKLVPSIDYERCNFCARCEEVCAYNAIVVVKDKVMIFPELCHSCGACSVLCPAIKETKKKIGVIRKGKKGKIDFYEGVLDVGEPMATPLIRKVKKKGKGLTIVDCPPGTACPVMESVRGSNYILLVTEATPFGLSDLGMAIDAFKDMGVGMGVIVNKSLGYGEIEEFCEKRGIEVLMRIPLDKQIAEGYSEGRTLLDMGRYKGELKDLYRRIGEADSCD